MADLCTARGHVLQQDHAREHALDPCADRDRQMHESQLNRLCSPSCLSHARSLRDGFATQLGFSIIQCVNRDDKAPGYHQRQKNGKKRNCAACVMVCVWWCALCGGVWVCVVARALVVVVLCACFSACHVFVFI